MESETRCDQGVKVVLSLLGLSAGTCWTDAGDAGPADGFSPVQRF